MNRTPRAALALALVAAVTAAPAATRYVTDELRISVRTGTGEQYRIIEVIDSGTRVETLTSEGDWTQVRTPQGNTGWVRGQYLAEEPIAAARLETARADLEAARARIDELEQSLAQAREELRSASARNDALADEIETLEGRLDQAREGLELQQENEQLRQQVSRLESRVGELRQEIGRLTDRRRREWFLIGGGVALGAMLFGMLVTRIPWRSRRDRLF